MRLSKLNLLIKLADTSKCLVHELSMRLGQTVIVKRFVVPTATCLNSISYQFTAISHLDILFVTGYSTSAHEMFVSNRNILSLQ